MSDLSPLLGSRQTFRSCRSTSAIDPGRVKTLRGITAPGILGSTVMRRAKKRKNLSSARHYDQIRFRFHTWGNSGHRAIPTLEESALQEPTSPPMGFAFMEDRNGILCWTGRIAEADSDLHC